MTHRKIALLSLSLALTAFHTIPAGMPAKKLIRASGVQGGIVVHLGCGEGNLTSALHLDERFLVHSLDTDAGNVEKAKAHIDSLGLYGRVSAETFDGKNLPYGDNIVNLIIADDVSGVADGEIERVLAPGGVLLGTDGTIKRSKPVPADIDQWTHFLYDATGNAVSKDKQVRRPRHVQWYAGPKRSRHHDALASLSAMTSSGGRVFYLFDEGATSLMHRPPDWKLVARDAFNGKLLWKRDIPDWMTHLYNFRAGPKQLPRRLVSVGDNVYVTLGFNAPAMKLDGASGKTLLTYEGSEKTEELVYHDGLLLAVIGDPEILIEKSDECHGYWELAEQEEPAADKSIVAYDAETGRKRWSVTGGHLKHAVPLSLCALGDNVFYLDNKQLHCVDAKSGKPRWAAPFETEGLFIRSYAPTVVAHGDVILCLKWDRLVAYAISSGKQLWENKGAIGFGSPGDLFAIDDKVWAVPMTRSIWRESRRNKAGVVTTGINIPKTDFLNEAKTAVGIDIRTGKITELLPFAHTQHHHRCYRNKATEDVLLIGHSGIQVVDLAKKTSETHRWVRGLCQYGIMPANGCIYVPPDNCQCYNSGKINGFFALSEKNSWEDIQVEPDLRKGPAFSRIASKRDADPTRDQSWPTYRGNNARNGMAACDVSASLSVKWRADIGKTLTAPVIAGERLFAADRDAYSVYCLDARNGKVRWKHLANGPVDSPPAIYKGLCLFGCADGSVTCLDAETGALAWRFKTSKIERRIGHDDRLASPLRIHGSVLVQEDIVYFAAGYSSNLDGGIRLYGIDLWTGEQRHTGRLASGPWGSDGQWGYLADILASNGNTIGMRNLGFDSALKKAKGRGPIAAGTGLLEDAWYHREGWSTSKGGRGQLIVCDEQRTFSVSSPYTGLKKRRKGQSAAFKQDGHLHQKFTRYEEEFFPVGTTITTKGKGGAKGKAGWTKDVKVQPRAMAIAGDKLCLAGWVDEVAIEMKSGRPKNPENPDPHDSVLRMYSADQGRLIAETQLDDEPVFDGLAVANRRLFLSLKNGSIVCMGD